MLRIPVLLLLLAAAAFPGDVPVARAFASDAGWVVAPGGKDRVSITLAASAAWTGTLRCELCDADGKVLSTHEDALAISAGGESNAATALDFTGRPVGEHLVRWRLLGGGKDDRRQEAGWERSCMVADGTVAFILFEHEPIARGLDLRRDRCAPVDIVAGGLGRSLWRAGYQSAAQGWWHSFRMTFTDDAFRRGAAPIVDVDVRYRQTSDAPVNLAADTARGSGEVANGWGGRGPDYDRDPPIQRLATAIDDAVFAATDHHAKPEAESADGCDLRFNACTADAELRSIVVRRYRRDGDVDWKRMLRPLGVELGRDRYVFAPGARVDAQVRLANRALVPFRAKARVTFSVAVGAELWSRELPVDIASDREGALAVPIDTKGLPRGVYALRVAIGDHVRTETLLALSDERPLAKAKDGEFFYGTDIGGHWTEARKLDWADFMGFDLIRNCARGGGGATDLADIDGAIAELRRRGLRGAIMLDPAWDPDPAKRAAENAKRAGFIAAVAKRHGDFLRWYELGNEPDLPFFYAGPTDAYVEGCLALRAAIKANDPDSVVMNGGLCFAGEEAWRRAHEIVARWPADAVEAWAYHGHGPGAGAERNAWNRQDETVKAVGKGGHDYIETESGLFANDPPTWRRQAQTIVEKAVFAQARHAPFFQWFSLNMGGGDWGYTTIEREREPRPAVLAQRTMVSVLRGLRHAGELDLVAPEAEAHLFAADDGRRALVLWSDHGEVTRTIAIGPGCTGLTRTDLYGNAAPLAEAAPGLAQTAIDADPVFISWRAGDAAFAVVVPPPPLVVPATLRVVPGRASTLPVTVRNPTPRAWKAKLTATTVGAAPARVEPAARELAVPGAGAADAALTVAVDAVAPSAWPRQWTVFAPVAGDVDLAALRDIPRELKVGGATVAPLVGVPVAHDLDLGRLAGGQRERKQALCFAWLDAERAGEVEIGAAADWWMEWYVNGERVFSTMEAGNQGPYAVLTHVFTARLRAGRNLLAVRVLSGSGGWRLVSGGPDEVAAARRERAGARDGLALELTVDGRLLAREPIAVEVLRPVERIAGGAVDWTMLAPDGALGAVVNRFAAQPESRRWHQGADDFSGRCWLRDDGASLRVAVAVRDDAHRDGDRCVLRLATGAVLGAPVEVAMTARRDEAAKTTWWEAAVPRATIGADRFAVQVMAIDDDWGEEKQRAAWPDGDRPEAWFQAWLR